MAESEGETIASELQKRFRRRKFVHIIAIILSIIIIFVAFAYAINAEESGARLPDDALFHGGSKSMGDKYGLMLLIGIFFCISLAYPMSTIVSYGTRYKEYSEYERDGAFKTGLLRAGEFSWKKIFLILATLAIFLALPLFLPSEFTGIMVSAGAAIISMWVGVALDSMLSKGAWEKSLRFVLSLGGVLVIVSIFIALLCIINYSIGYDMYYATDERICSQTDKGILNYCKPYSDIERLENVIAWKGALGQRVAKESSEHYFFVTFKDGTRLRSPRLLNQDDARKFLEQKTGLRFNDVEIDQAVNLY